MNEHCIVLVTAATPSEAEKIAEHLLDKRLAACCNIISDIHSLFHWQGGIGSEKEVLMILKTRVELFDTLKETVLKYHSYDTPEIIALPVIAGTQEYLDWIDKETSE